MNDVIDDDNVFDLLDEDTSDALRVLIELISILFS
jgi:hypothetical protein